MNRPPSPERPREKTGLPVRTGMDWGELAPLRLRSRLIAQGVYAGLHRSTRRGAGIEFGGYREYVPGDDLRWLDRRSMLRHDRLLVRQFETETDRVLFLLVDASASMGYRSAGAPGSKLAFAAVVSAALARIALANGDPVSLSFLAGSAERGVGRSGGREQCERVLTALEGLSAQGDVGGEPLLLDAALQEVLRSTRRGAIVVVVSDLLDWPDRAAERLATIASTGRVLAVVQALDPAEAEFPFTGTVRLRALEGDAVVETDADARRDEYLAALDAVSQRFRDAVLARGGRFLKVRTDQPPVDVVRSVAHAVG